MTPARSRLPYALGVGFLHRFWITHDRIEIDKSTVMLGVVLGPDRFHGLDLITKQAESCLEAHAMVFDLLGDPPCPDAKNKGNYIR